MDSQVKREVDDRQFELACGKVDCFCNGKRENYGLGELVFKEVSRNRWPGLLAMIKDRNTFLHKLENREDREDRHDAG